MAAPCCKAPGFWIRGTNKHLGDLFTLISKRFCSTATASKPLSAQSLAERLRAQKQEQKQKLEVPANPVQRRVQELVRYTQQLQRVHPNVLAKALTRGILYQDTSIVVINKPYGLPVHGGPGVQLCINEVLPILAKMLHGYKAEPLHLCHRLDKETTGVMVLAWEKEMAHQIQELFRTRQVVKKYWAITVRVPMPSAGVVDIPIIEKEVKGQQHHHKMTLAPTYRMDNGKMVKVPSSRNAHIAVTQYQVLSSTLSSALVELQPITGIKHQLRVHLSFGLDCPILGDHKYSDWNRLAPQLDLDPSKSFLKQAIHYRALVLFSKLSAGILKKLGLEQSKARHIPLHLHARQLVLPALGSRKEELNLVCKVPRFFARTVHRLGLEMPSQDQSRDNQTGQPEAQ